MSEIFVTCSECGTQFYMYDYEAKACPHCGKVARGPKSSSDIYVTCNNCGEKFYIYSWESKPCPHCGKVVRGPQA
ncbi:MAG: hypothetical protein N3F03_04220 [Ignavibacteria bacterium]|nr:hypothetical protein [Ignavibacteria bacterium]